MRRLPLVAAVTALAVCSVHPAFPQELTVDTAGAGTLIDQALNHSEVMQNLQYLSDGIGPRLTGSPAARRANDWTRERFAAYGLTAHLEPWTFGGTWVRGPMRARLTARRAHDVTAASWAWAPGTAGATVTGPLVRIDASTPDSFAAYRRRAKGAWVMTRPPSPVWNGDGPLGWDSVVQWNTVAEIRGTERPGEVVIVGAHLDSWDLGTGTTDNGTGAMCTLEAARVIAQSGLRPKRTIRFVLFTGEEQGLIGSRKYAEAHAGEADSIQAVIVLDNGTGAITGQALQGRTDLEGLWRAVLAPWHTWARTRS